MIYQLTRAEFVRRRKIAISLLAYQGKQPGVPYRAPGRFDVRFPVLRHPRLRRFGWLPQSIAVPIAVPNLIGSARAVALVALAAVRLSAGSIGTAFSTLYPVGTVISQNPPAGRLAGVGAPVSFVLSLGANTGFRVIAITAGEYNGKYYVPGDVFDLLQASDFSDSSVNYGPDSADIQLGWMSQVSSATPLYQWQTQTDSPYFPPQDPARRFVY
jgi:hypothetical protein